jgi:hypothetical protein
MKQAGLKPLRGFRFAVLVAGIFLLVCCQKSNNHHPKTATLKAEFTTVSTILKVGPPEVDSIVGKGNGVPFGKSSFITIAQFDDSYELTGAIKVTAENGDHIFATITGHAPEIDDKGAITLHFDATIAGGTGKYAGATGSFAGVAHESIYDAEGSATWEGTITY